MGKQTGWIACSQARGCFFQSVKGKGHVILIGIAFKHPSMATLGNALVDNNCNPHIFRRFEPRSDSPSNDNATLSNPFPSLLELDELEC